MNNQTDNVRTAWLRSQLGQRVYALERKLAAEALAQVFGWQLLQIGLWGDGHELVENARTQRKVVLAREFMNPTDGILSLQSRTDALAVVSDSVDAVLLPHTLEYEPDPHGLLREVERILPGDGQLIVMGFRPFSSWGTRHLFARNGFPPGTEQLISEYRLRDWLKLLGFEITDARRYLFTWPWGAAAPRAERFLENVGNRLWPLFAGAYLIKARKRVYALTPIRPRWRAPKPVMGGLIEPTSRVSGDIVSGK
jgi:SAM-dependent methyltransferase